MVALSGLLAYALIAAALGVSDGKFDPVALGFPGAPDARQPLE